MGGATISLYTGEDVPLELLMNVVADTEKWRLAAVWLFFSVRRYDVELNDGFPRKNVIFKRKVSVKF